MGKLVVIAGNSGPFADFSPHAPAINDQGTVAFFATRRHATPGIFCGDGGPIHPLRRKATYHGPPAINNAGTVAALAELSSGIPALLRGSTDRPPQNFHHEAIASVGPHGPTLNSSGQAAFRATSIAGHAGIYLADAHGLHRLVEVGERFAAFDGQPRIADDGSVAFRADHTDGTHGLHRWLPGTACTCLAESGEHFAELGSFPDTDASGRVVFTATTTDGSPGVFLASDGAVRAVFSAGKHFENIRGALIDDAGRILMLATPGDGATALFSLEPGGPRRLIGLRDDFGACPLIDLAIGTSSFNNSGQVALRLRLADARQFIARLDVFDSPTGAR